MKIALVAMSGVRAHADWLNEVGMTLPGFVERKEVIASMPSLGLLTLAAMTPPDIEVSYHEVRDLRDPLDLPADLDLVALSTFSAQALDAYELAGELRAAGIPVAIGGLHATVLPEEAMGHCDAVVVGEGEISWPRLVEDLRRGRLQEVYRPLPGEWWNLAASPVPRYELLDPDRYNRLTVQTSRGCPHRCDFCASSILLTPKYRVKPVDAILREIHAVRAVWPRPFLELADDDSFVVRAHAMELLEALRAESIPWFTEADVSIADDPELLEAMRRAGCRQVLIGLESPVAAGLAGIELRRDWKSDRQPDYLEAVRTIQAHGITVNGCFVLGLDGHDETIFGAVEDFVAESGLYEVQVTAMTPFPGTPLYQRLLREGRILDPGNWRTCTLFDVNFVPNGMSAGALQGGLVDLARRLYQPGSVRRRREAFFARLRRGSSRGSSVLKLGSGKALQ